jgi:hypothetical protein
MTTQLGQRCVVIHSKQMTLQMASFVITFFGVVLRPNQSLFGRVLIYNSKAC